MITLRRPDLADLPAYRDALLTGYSPNNLDPEFYRLELALIEADAKGFVTSLDDPEARGAPVRQPDGSFKPRLPGLRRWIFAPDFAGSISLRWQPGTEALPPHVSGHIGYSILASRRNQGIATRALALILPEAAACGLRHVDIMTDAGNIASQRVVVNNGGLLIDAADPPSPLLRYRITLAATSAATAETPGMPIPR